MDLHQTRTFKHEAWRACCKGATVQSSCLTLHIQTSLLVSCGKVRTSCTEYSRWCVVAVFVATFVQFFFTWSSRVLFWIVGNSCSSSHLLPCCSYCQTVCILLMAQTITSLQLQLFLYSQNIRPTSHRAVVHLYPGMLHASPFSCRWRVSVTAGTFLIRWAILLRTVISYVAMASWCESGSTSLEDLTEAVTLQPWRWAGEDAADNTVAYDSVDPVGNAKAMKQVHKVADADATRRYSLKQHMEEKLLLRAILLVVHLSLWSSWSFWRRCWPTGSIFWKANSSTMSQLRRPAAQIKDAEAHSIPFHQWRD